MRDFAPKVLHLGLVSALCHSGPHLHLWSGIVFTSLFLPLAQGISDVSISFSSFILLNSQFSSSEMISSLQRSSRSQSILLGPYGLFIYLSGICVPVDLFTLSQRSPDLGISSLSFLLQGAKDPPPALAKESKDDNGLTQVLLLLNKLSWPSSTCVIPSIHASLLKPLVQNLISSAKTPMLHLRLGLYWEEQQHISLLRLFHLLNLPR